MRRPVLLGGRSALRTRSLVLWLVLVWLPVLVCLLVVMRESSDDFSSERTSGPLRHLFEWIVGPVAPYRWDQIHHAMRKTGHFLGYGFTGLAWLRAWLLVWLAPLRLRSLWLWRRLSFLMALCCTVLVAAADEIHQTYIPSRTGLFSDACLDTAGALALMVLMLLFWIRRPWQREPQVRL